MTNKKPKKTYHVLYKGGVWEIEADMVIEKYDDVNRLMFYIGALTYTDSLMAPCVASFPLNKSAIVKVINN